MSEENIEIVRRASDAWNRQDIEGDTRPDRSRGRVRQCLDSRRAGDQARARRIVAVVRNQWESLPGALLEVDRASTTGATRSSPRATFLVRCLEVMLASAIPILHSYKFRDGKIIRLEKLGAGPDFPDALKAAGLSE